MKIENTIFNLSEIANFKLGNEAIQTRKLSINQTDLGNQFKNLLNEIDKKIDSSGQVDANFKVQIKKAPKELRSMFELQRAAYRLNSSTELLSKAAESLSSSLKKLQQMGSS